MKIKLASIVVIIFIITGLSVNGYARDIEVDPDVNLVSSGPFSWHMDKGFRFRVVTILSEVSINIFIQRVDYGDETCCARVTKTYEIVSDKIEHPLYTVSSIKWLTVDSFTFTGNSTNYKVTGLDSSYKVEKNSVK